LHERELVVSHSLSELLNASACIDKLLLACVKRMALGADIYMKNILRGYRLESLTAGALDSRLVSLRMDSVFHRLTSHQWTDAYALCQNTLIRMPIRIYAQMSCYYTRGRASMIFSPSAPEKTHPQKRSAVCFREQQYVRLLTAGIAARASGRSSHRLENSLVIERDLN